MAKTVFHQQRVATEKPTMSVPIGFDECIGLCTHRDPPISDGREAAVDSQLHPIHEAQIV